MDFSKYLFRCSALGHLMTEVQGDSNLVKWEKAQAKLKEIEAAVPKEFNKDGSVSKLYDNWLVKLANQELLCKQLHAIKDEITLSETAKVHLSDLHTAATTGRQNDIENKYIKKGLLVEEDGITVYSRNKKKFFKKNEKHLSNNFIMGTPDIFEGESIESATSVPDIKCSWDLYTFRRTVVKKLNQLYYWQLQGYMWLTGAKNAPLAYCLVDTPEPLILSAEKSLWYKIGCPNDFNEMYLEACAELRKSMTYDDIPLNERLLEYVIERNDEDIAKIENYVKEGRKYLQWLDDEIKQKQN